MSNTDYYKKLINKKNNNKKIPILSSNFSFIKKIFVFKLKKTVRHKNLYSFNYNKN